MSLIRLATMGAFAAGIALVARALWAGPVPGIVAPGSPGGPSVPSSPLTPTHEAPDVKDASIYHTAPDDVDPASFVWTMSDAGKVLAVPIRDKRTGNYARLTYRDALIVAAKYGVRLLTKTELDLIDAQARREGHQLGPCILPAGPAMASRAYADKEDACIDAQLSLKWDRKSVTSNAGKEYVADAPGSKARIYGWFSPTGAPIQGLSEAHSASYTDYSQLTRFHA